jgi:Aminoglycoside-2''-adenylyltransferase
MSAALIREPNMSFANQSFDSIISAASVMHGFGLPWFISGGWAIDLFLGRVTRGHADIEIGTYRRDQRALSEHMHGWAFEKAIQTPGRKEWVCWEIGEELQLPIHQIKAKDVRGGFQEIEFFLNERTETDWLSRRHPGLTRLIDEVAISGSHSIPILAPEIQLLFKAQPTRAKDELDFAVALPRLNASQRNWLARSLRAYHPEHEWRRAIEKLGCREPSL